jgi:hypothetical protein
VKYLFSVPIEKVTGHMLFLVEAASQRAAEKLVKSNTGKHPVVYHEVVALSVGDPTFLGEARSHDVILGERGC